MKHALSMLAVLLCVGSLATQETAKDRPGPVAGYVDLERYEIRYEVVAQLDSLIPADQLTSISAAERASILSHLQERLNGAAAITADGAKLRFDPLEIQFIQFDPELGPVPDPREVIPGGDAAVGASFVAARDGFPKQLEIDWRLTSADRPVEVAVQMTTLSGTSVDTLSFTPGSPPKTWKVPEVAPEPGAVSMNVEAGTADSTPLVIAIVLLLSGLLIAGLSLMKPRGKRSGSLVTAGIAFAIGVGSLIESLDTSSRARLEPDEARGVAGGLLNNIYRGFAYRSETAIFDTLARSVDGPLLEQLYLDIRRGLNVEESDGPLVKVLKVTLVDCELQRSDRDGFRARLIWVSEGSVTHWGHVHHRRNQYRGDVEVAVIDGRWKVTGVEILEEQRV